MIFFYDGLFNLLVFFIGIMVDSSVEVNWFPKELLRENLATDKTDAVVCATRHVVFKQKASEV